MTPASVTRAPRARAGVAAAILCLIWPGCGVLASPPAPTRVPVAPAAVRPATVIPLRPAQRAASVGTPAFATVPIVLPPVPAIAGLPGGILYRARLAIAQAQQVDPQAAQTAAFQYVQAVQQYQSGNFAAARISALQALSGASSAQVRLAVPAPFPDPALLAGSAPQRPGTAGGLYGADAPAIDADTFLALARGTLDDCAARHDTRLRGAQQQLSKAQRDFAARDWEATRLDAKAAIDACAKPRL